MATRRIFDEMIVDLDGAHWGGGARAENISGADGLPLGRRA